MAVIRPPRRTPPVWARPNLQSTPTPGANGEVDSKLGSIVDIAQATTAPKGKKGKKGGDKGKVNKAAKASQRRRLLLEDQGPAVSGLWDVEDLNIVRRDELWLDGGIVQDTSWDLNKLVLEDTRIESFNWSNDGLTFLQVSSIDDKVSGFTCTTPYDISTGTLHGSKATGGIVPRNCKMAATGTHWWVERQFFDAYDVYVCGTLFEIDTTDTLLATGSKADLGWNNGGDTIMTFNADGTAVYAVVDRSVSTIHLAKTVCNTPFDLDDLGDQTLIDINADLNTVSTGNDCMDIDPTESTIMFLVGNRARLGRMSIPGDVSTFAMDSTTIGFVPTENGTETCAQITQDGTALWYGNNTVAAHQLTKFTQSGKDNVMGATGTLGDISAFSKLETLTDGGAGSLDLNPIVTGQTTSILQHIDWALGGKYFACIDGTNDNYGIFACSTPYDISTATLSGVRDTFLATNPTQIGMDYWGRHTYFMRDNNDSIHINNLSTAGDPFVVAATDTTLAFALDTELGHTQAADGIMTFSEDGYSLYGMIEKADGVYMAKGEINPVKKRYDVDEITTVTDISIDTDFSSLGSPLTSCMKVCKNETYILYMVAEVLYKGTMSTPGDVTTLTWDMVNTLDVSADGIMTGFAYNEDLTKFWFADNTSGTPTISVYT